MNKLECAVNWELKEEYFKEWIALGLIANNAMYYGLDVSHILALAPNLEDSDFWDRANEMWCNPAAAIMADPKGFEPVDHSR